MGYSHLNLNVIAQNEPSTKNLMAPEAQMDTSTDYSRTHVSEGAEEVIHRALALRHMELPVGDFIKDGLEREVPEAVDKLLDRMSLTKKTMTSLSVTSPKLTATDPLAEKEALKLRDAWIAHPDHTIAKAMVAERAIFFVLLPFFRFNGDAGMRAVVR